MLLDTVEVTDPLNDAEGAVSVLLVASAASAESRGIPFGPIGTAPTPGMTNTGAAAGATSGKPKMIKAASPQASQSTSSMPEVG